MRLRSRFVALADSGLGFTGLPVIVFVVVVLVRPYSFTSNEGDQRIAFGPAFHFEAADKAETPGERVTVRIEDH
jgi:hypothetical protein